MTGLVAAADSVTVKARSLVPLLPSVTVASATERVGSTGGARIAGRRPTPLIVKPDAVVPPLPGVAWKPNDAACPAATWPFQSALLHHVVVADMADDLGVPDVA